MSSRKLAALAAITLALVACVDRVPSIDAGAPDATTDGTVASPALAAAFPAGAEPHKVGEAPSRPQGPVANPNADIAGNYNTGPWGDAGLWARALQGLVLGWDGGTLPSTPGYLFDPADGGPAVFVALQITPLDAGGTGVSIAPGALGTCLGYVDAGGGATAIANVACGTGGDGGGITQITGDMTVGPGTGSQVGTVNRIWSEPFADGGTNPPSAQNTWIWTGFMWVPGMVSLSAGVTGTLGVANGGTGITDAGTVANLCYVTNGTGGVIVAPCPPASVGLDLAAGDGGQVVVGITGDDGGAPIPVHVQGLAVDGLQPSFSVTVASPPDAATAPAGIVLQPGAPNAAASTTTGGTPGSVYIELPATLSTGKEAALNLSRAGAGSGAVSIGMEQGFPNSPQILLETDAGTAVIQAQGANGGSLSLMAPAGQPVYVGAGSALEVEFSAPYLLMPGVSTLQLYGGKNITLGQGGASNTLNTAPHVFALYAEDSNLGSTSGPPNGGDIPIIAGAGANPGVTGWEGHAGLALGTQSSAYRWVVDATAVGINKRGVCLSQLGLYAPGSQGGCSSSDVTSGDGWTLFADAQTVPTTAPLTGTQCWSAPSTHIMSCWTAGASAPFVVGAGLTTPVSVPNGGTGQTSYGTSGQCLQSQGASNPTTWGSCGSGGCNSVGGTAGDIISAPPGSCGATVNMHVGTITGDGSGTVNMVANEMLWGSSAAPLLDYPGTNTFTWEGGGAMEIAAGSGAPIILNPGSYTELYSTGTLEWYAGALVGQPTVGAFYSALVSGGPQATNFALAANGTVTSVNAVTQTNLNVNGGNVVAVTATNFTAAPATSFDLKANGQDVLNGTQSTLTLNPTASITEQVNGTTVESHVSGASVLNNGGIALENSGNPYFEVTSTGSWGSHLAFIGNPPNSSTGSGVVQQCLMITYKPVGSGTAIDGCIPVYNGHP